MSHDFLPDDLPDAEMVRAHKCENPRCPNIHLVLYDAEDEPMAHCCVTPDWLRGIIAEAEKEASRVN